MADRRSVRHRAVNSQNLKLYLEEIAHIPPLEPEEEKDLARRIHRGDKTALRIMVESNLKFVVSFAKKYRGCGLSFLDLINEGNLGLIEAARRFDPDRDVRFLTYAVWWIRQSILHALQETTGTVRLPQKQANRVHRLGKTRSRLTRELAREPTVEELAQEMAMSTEQVEKLQRLSGDDISLDMHLSEDGALTLADRLEQETIPPADHLLARKTLLQTLGEVMGELTEREQRILTLRFGLKDNKPHTLREIGEMMGLSRERIRQIEAQALKKLKANEKCQWLKGVLN